MKFLITMCGHCHLWKNSVLVGMDQEIRPWTHMMEVPQLHGLGPAASRLLDSYKLLLKVTTYNVHFHWKKILGGASTQTFPWICYWMSSLQVWYICWQLRAVVSPSSLSYLLLERMCSPKFSVLRHFCGLLLFCKHAWLAVSRLLLTTKNATMVGCGDSYCETYGICGTHI